jgi:pimeloyl-ACP methyl ester carboxylesterase
MEKSILLLHGALGCSNQLQQLREQLTQFHKVYLFNFAGHGGVDIPKHLTMDVLVEQLRNFIVEKIPKDDHLTIFGYSMGGYAALVLATQKTCKIDTIITLGTKMIWNNEIAANEIKMLNPEIIEEKFPEFAEDLKNKHLPQDWKLLLKATSEMMIDLGERQYLTEDLLSNCKVKCRLMLGDRDKMVSLEETVWAYKKIPGSELTVLPKTGHPIEKVNLKRLIFELENI